MIRNSVVVTFLLILFAVQIVSSEVVQVSGVVQNGSLEPLGDAEVKLQSMQLVGTTDGSGRFTLESEATAISSTQFVSAEITPVLRGTNLSFALNRDESVSLTLFNLRGQQIHSVAKHMSSGVNQIALPNISNGVYIYRLSLGTSNQSGKISFGTESVSLLQTVAKPSQQSSSSSRAATVDDTLIVSKNGYKTELIPTSYTATHTVTLQEITDMSWSMISLPETGQGESYTDIFGEDSDYEINSLSYTDNGDGTVTDNVTGLMWQQGDGGLLGYGDAVEYSDTLTLAGYDDWQLPDAHEAFSIQNQGTSNPSIDLDYFTDTEAGYWWTKSVGLNKPGRIWVSNEGGGIGPHDTLESVTNGGERSISARCVRSTFEGVNQHNFSVISDSIVRDENSGLEWCQFNLGEMGWEEALAFAENLSLGGHDDWRLPNIKELHSINDESLVYPSLDTTVFLEVMPEDFDNKTKVRTWSSTVLANHTEMAWYVDFVSGLISYADRSTDLLEVRVVR
jgi:hypothetical protein